MTTKHPANWTGVKLCSTYRGMCQVHVHVHNTVALMKTRFGSWPLYYQGILLLNTDRLPIKFLFHFDLHVNYMRLKLATQTIVRRPKTSLCHNCHYNYQSTPVIQETYIQYMQSY